MDRKPRSLDELLLAASNGDNEAFSEFCGREIVSLYRYMEYQCSIKQLDPGLAIDFSNEAFLKASRAISIRADTGDRRPVSVQWVRSIAYNVMLDYLKRENRYVAVGDYDKAIESVPQGEQREEILKYFAWLSDDDREMLELMYYKGMPSADVAAHMGLSKDVVNKRHQRALIHIRDCISEHSPIGAKN